MTATFTGQAPPLALQHPGCRLETRADGARILSAEVPLGPYPRSLTESLAAWAQLAPERVLVAERAGDGWRTVTYAQAWDAAQRIGQALLDRGLSTERPVMILSGSSVNHALLALAALHVGVPYVPVSTGYSLLSTDFERVRHIVGLTTPGLVFVERGLPFAAAVAAAVPGDVELVSCHEPVPGRPHTPFDRLLDTPATAEVAAAAARVDADTIGKILFTSGSSAMPKGVLNTQRMLCANQQMHAQVWPFLRQRPPVFMDWAPWNHTLGSNAVFGMALYNGGSLYIDSGKPTPEGVGEMVRNLTEVPPTAYLAVPVVYQLLLPHLEQNARFRERFFSRLDMLFYAGATLPHACWSRLRELAAGTGRRVFMTSALGCTETAPTLATAPWDCDRPGVLGLPVPGMQIKLVPTAGKLAVWVRGPAVTPGYWRQPEVTARAFDAEGWYGMGDAVRFVDEADPSQGLLFDGRLSEDFKLATGNWVNVGPLRAQVNAQLAPLVLDVVICGEARLELGAVVFPNLERCRELAALPADTPAEGVLAHPVVRQAFQQRLDGLAAAEQGSSRRMARLVLIAEPASGFEMTDKRLLSHQAVLQRRAADIERLYADVPSDRVLVAQARATAGAPAGAGDVL